MLATRHLGSVTDQFAAEADYWDVTYRGSDVRSLIYRRRQELSLRWVDALQLPPGARVLDVGTGAGHAAIALAQRGFQAEAVDIAEPMLEHVRKNAAAAGVADRVATRVAEAHALYCTDASLDLVIALGVLPWVEQPGQALAEMRRVLRPGGHLIVTTANRWKLTYRLDPLHSQDLQPLKRPIRALIERAGYWPSGRPQSFLHSIDESDRLVATAGFERLAGTTLGFGPFTFLGRRVLSPALGARVHLRLQRLADRGVRGLRGAGTEYLILARRPISVAG
jgi:ubiquinone/menaquinone biosynthesis C-methylase UbiE